MGSSYLLVTETRVSIDFVSVTARKSMTYAVKLVLSQVDCTISWARVFAFAFRRSVPARGSRPAPKVTLSWSTIWQESLEPDSVCVRPVAASHSSLLALASSSKTAESS